MRIVRLVIAAISISPVLILAGCTTSTPRSVPGLSGVMGDYLPGTKGLTLEDQKNIDLTVAGGCSGGVYTKGACARHTKASQKRHADLNKERVDGR